MTKDADASAFRELVAIECGCKFYREVVGVQERLLIEPCEKHEAINSLRPRQRAKVFNKWPPNVTMVERAWRIAAPVAQI